MTLLAFLLAPQNAVFASALVVVVGLGAVEVFGALLGTGLSQALGAVDMDMDVEVEVDVDVDTNLGQGVGGDADIDGVLSLRLLAVTSAFGFGRLPLTLVMLTGAMSLAGSGYSIQAGVYFMTGSVWRAGVAAALAVVATLPLWWLCIRAFSSLIPDDGPSVAHIDDFVGAVAVVVNGPARYDAPGQARFVDGHGHQQYVLVEPEDKRQQFNTGATVVLFSRRGGARFFAVAAPFAAAGPE